MAPTRFTALVLAACLALPCFLAVPAQGMVDKELRTSGPTNPQAEREKQAERDERDRERAKAYEEEDKPAKPKEHLEIIIHTN